jgi:transcriptional regulator with XRE-family HTH domain
MNPQLPAVLPGQRLKKLRLSVGLSTREVERRSRQIVASRHNAEYLVSHSWLRSIEAGSNLHTPSIYKIYSLSVLYNRSGTELASYFGVPFGDIGKDRAMFEWPTTHLLDPIRSTEPTLAATRSEVAIPDVSSFDSNSTVLLTKLAQIWGDIPTELIRKLDTRHSLYAYIGQKDFTLYPLILPGSFVQIDPTQTKIRRSPARRELDRPIYFIELRDGYACGWCELKDGRLNIIPHLNSPQSIRSFIFPAEADIVGRVTGVAMRIAGSGFSDFQPLTK